jgi:hypothetical protein
MRPLRTFAVLCLATTLSGCFVLPLGPGLAVKSPAGASKILIPKDQP